MLIVFITIFISINTEASAKALKQVPASASDTSGTYANDNAAALSTRAAAQNCISAESTIKSKNFIVCYNNTVLPSYAKDISNYAEDSLDFFVSKYSYAKPDTAKLQDGLLPIYIMANVEWGHFNFIFTGNAKGELKNAEIFISSNMSYIDGTTATVEDVQTTVAHEVYHAIQTKYLFNDRLFWKDKGSTAKWVSEGASRWVEGIYKAGYGGWAWKSTSYPAYLERTDKSLFEQTYDASGFWQYLSEKYGNDIAKNSFLKMGNADTDSDVMSAIGQAAGTSFKREFTGFLLKNVVKQWKDDNAQYLPDVTPSRVENKYPISREGDTVNPWAADYIKFTGGTGGKLTINFDGEDGKEFFVSVIKLKNGNVVKVENQSLRYDNKRSIVIANFGADFDEVFLIVGGLDNSNTISYDYTANFESYIISIVKETSFSIPQDEENIGLKLNVDNTVEGFALTLGWITPDLPSIELTDPTGKIYDKNTKDENFVYEGPHPIEVQVKNLAQKQKGEWKIKINKDTRHLSENFNFKLKAERVKPRGLPKPPAGINFTNFDITYLNTCQNTGDLKVVFRGVPKKGEEAATYKIYMDYINGKPSK